jgi:hypothetical protein
MFRRAFLVAGASAIATAPVLAAASENSTATGRKLLKSYITSIDPSALANLSRGAILQLRRDAKRRYEPAAAVAVLSGHHRIGYLPGSVGKLIAPLLESGAVELRGLLGNVKSGERAKAELDIYIG